jgi:kinesin family protein 6/9
VDKVSQQDAFRTIGIPAIQNALPGFNSTIFAYGQTGSGKTFTITGGPEKYEDRGLIPRALSHLFKAMKDEEQKGSSFLCFISYLEIYNQSSYYLLVQSNNGNTAFEEVPKVTMLKDEDGNFHFKNLSLQKVASEEDALNLLFLGDTNRVIAGLQQRR